VVQEELERIQALLEDILEELKEIKRGFRSQGDTGGLPCYSPSLGMWERMTTPPSPRNREG